MKLSAGCILACAILCSSLWCAPKSAKLQKSNHPPDKTLYETGDNYLKKGQYIRARLSFQTLINTYPDSDLAADAKFAMANSFYVEGGTENLLQAEDGFKDFIIFYPTNIKAPDAQLKIISLNVKMMRSPDRDQKYSHETLREIQNFRRLFPDSPFLSAIDKMEIEAKNRLAQQDLMVMKFYGDKGNYAGALGRSQNIQEKYKDFSEMDEVLFHTGTYFEKAMRPEEAAICFTEIARGYSNSKFFDDAKMKLKWMDKPIPSVDEALVAKNQKLKPSNDFAPWKIFIEVGKGLGLVGPPDKYAETVKTLEEEKAAKLREELKSAAVKPREGNAPPDGFDIERRITRNESGVTTVEKLPPASSGATPNNAEEKPAALRYKKKPSKTTNTVEKPVLGYKDKSSKTTS
jgi:outer membrane protein assembly factor BamD